MLTLIFIIFFVTLIEIPAVIMLGIWFVLQFVPAIGQVRHRRGLGRRRRLLGARRRIRLRPRRDQAVREPPSRGRAPGMRSAFLLVALSFCLVFGGMTAAVAAQSGFDIFTVVSFGIVGDDPDRPFWARCGTLPTTAEAGRSGRTSGRRVSSARRQKGAVI